MKATRGQAHENRERVLALAGEAFGRDGFDGVGLAGPMRAAGLTHGAFYGQFDAKEALAAEAAEAIACAFERTSAGLGRAADERADDPFAAVVRSFPGAAHRDRPALGCVLAARRPGRPIATLGVGDADDDRDRTPRVEDSA